MKNKTTQVCVFQKYGKFWSFSLGHFIKRKPLISEEWYVRKIVVGRYTVPAVLGDGTGITDDLV